MFFTKPNINFDQGWYKEPAAPDNPATAGEVFDTAWEASNRSELFGSSSRNLIDTYDAHNKRVEEITGKKFTNPATAPFFEFETDDERSQFYKDFGSYSADGGSLGERGYAYRWKEQTYRRKLTELADQYPDYRDQLLPEKTFQEQSYGLARDTERKAEETWERSGKGMLDWAAWIGGNAASGLTDPINIVTAPLGFGGVGTGLRGLAMGFLKNGMSNAAVEAAVQPFVQNYRSQAGMESGLAMGAMNVGAAFTLGGALDLGIRGTARGLRWSLGYEPVVDAKGVVIGYKKIAPSQPVDPAAPVKAPDADPSFISKDLIDRADAEDPAAMRAVAEKSGLINEPLVRSTFDAMDANERMVGSRPSETIADGEHAKGIVQTLRHINEPELEPMPVVRDGTTLDTIRGYDLDLAEVKAEIRMLKERAPNDADGLAKLDARVAEIRVAKFEAQREIMADDLIQAVDQGRMPQEIADLVVDHVADKTIQGRVASDLAKMRPTSPTEARHRLAQILSSPDYRPEVPAAPARGNGLARPALDDPYGADAKAQVVALEKEMAQELNAAGVKREGADAEGKVNGDGKDGKPAPELETANKIGKAIGDAIEAARSVAPAGTEFRIFSKVSELPEHLRAAVEKANAEIDAMFDPVSKAVYLSTAAIDPAGRLHHESVHALKAAGLLTDGEIRLLAERAAKFDDLPFDRAKYEAAYRDRYSEDGFKLALDEEAAAHLVEARSRGIDFGAEINSIADRILQFFERLRNALDGLGFKTADDVIDAILSGEVARRQAIQSFMEKEDITAVAVRPQPMYAIGKDPGLTDRVRSLIDWAFGLDKMPATADELLKVAREATGLEQQVGRMMTSMTKHEGRPVYLIDQIQSDWGQKLRDGGVRDEKKIAELRTRSAEARAQADAVRDEYRASLPEGDRAKSSIGDAEDRLRAMSNMGAPDGKKWAQLNSDATMLHAELRTAEATSPGHPLVNTTDQWTHTTLRRALRQAAEADADYIAIPSGKTVLSYNPGDTHGMEGFYNGIVPKNLRNLIQKLDKDAPAPVKIDKLETPTSGMKGEGFTLFPLTDKVKATVISEGQPLFAMRNDGRKTPGSDARKQYVKEDFDAIDAKFQNAGGDERLKLQAKRAALLNAKAHEKVSSDVMNHRDLGNQTDPGKAMMMVVENQGQATFQGLTTIRDIAIQTDLGEMGKMMWEMRKGAVLGDKRRNTAPVKTMLHNVIREAWGKDSGDATAKQFAQAYLASIEKRRQRWNHAGGDIKKLEGYAGPQYHDPEAWAAAGREEIVKYFTQDGVLDRSRMISFDTGAPMTDAELSDMMKGIWRNVVTEGAAAFEEGASAGAGRPGAKYKQRMEHRVLHFKDADAWLAYNEKYGSGDVYASIVGEAITMNRDIALMERLGANPLLTWERLKADVIREAQNAVASKSLHDEFQAKLDALRAKRKTIPRRVDTLRAKMISDMKTIDSLKEESKKSKRKAFRNRPKIVEMTSGLRETFLEMEAALKDNVESPEQLAIINEMIDIGGEMLDAGARTSMSRNPVERTQRLLKRADEMIKSYMGATNVPADDRLAAGMTATRNTLGATTLIYASFSALNDQMTQAMARLLTGLPLKSQISSYVKAFTKMDRQFALDTAIGLESVLPAVHESNRFVGSLNARHISGYVADRSHAFSFLSPMTTAAKVAFSLDFMKDFAGLRGTDFAELPEPKQRLFERHGITPADWEAIRKAEPEQHRGREHLTHRAIAKVAGYEVADKYLGMLYRERSYSTVEGLVRGRTAFISDTQSGSAQGEALRSMAMFKSFPVSYGMLIFGRLYEEVMKGRAMQPSVIGAAASIFIGGTILGALVIQLKQIAQGKDPRDMTDPKFWAQAFLQSGGLGIYGDFVASSINRQGSGLAGTIAGPVADLGGNVLDMTFGNIAQYASDEKTNAGREAVKLMRRLTPGMIAPWYIRTAVDRMVFDELQKVLDPEAHRSFQSRMRTTKKVGGNDFFWAPGTSEPQRGPNIGAIFGR